MSFLWATNSLAGFDVRTGNIQNGTVTADFDNTYINSAIKLFRHGRVNKILPVAQTDIWFHFEIMAGSHSSQIDDAFFYLGDAVNNVDLFSTSMNNSSGTVQYWNGSAWVNTLITYSLAANTVFEIDIHIVMSDDTNGGTIELFKDQVSQGTAYTEDTIWTSAVAIDRVSLQCSGNPTSIDTNISQIIVANESTIGCKVVAHTIDADGVTADWTGDYTDIPTGATSTLQNTSIAHSDTADQVMLVEPEDVISTALFPVGVVVNAHAKRGSTGPANIALAMRSDGVTYFSDDVALTEGYKSVSAIWEADPAGPKNWLEATLNAMECGVKSRT